ncbi:kinesin-like nuclear fusion protein [Lithohypha guttulata]|uniref:Kinesin-like protein n=1 Tax=Lithohypha guttulata TaxID=1690604 RepID=A0AAN7Q795_9EURO|nr:kinesin-like nuclear fusion protein [Lithohypha guttulata]
MENQTSMLPQPAARSTSSMRFLTDLSESESNVRSTMLPPSSATTAGLKRQSSNLPEPSQKRKTLAERAAEPLRPSPIMSTLSRPPSTASQYAPSSTIHYRSSSTASTLSRTNSASSRNTSNSSCTGSLTSGIRPPTINSGMSTARPKSSYAKDKPLGVGSRSLANLNASHEAYTKSKETPPFRPQGPRNTNSTTSEASRVCTKWNSMSTLRRANPQTMRSSAASIRDRYRDISLSTGLDQLHLDDDQKDLMLPPKTPTRSQSPSKIPRASPVPTAPVTPTPNPTGTPQLRHKSTMKANKFLTSTSNIENFDPDVPYQDWKRMFDDSRQMFEDAVNKMSNAKEETNVYKEQLSQVEQERSSQNESIISLKTENKTLDFRIATLEKTIRELKEVHEQRLEDIRNDQQRTIKVVRQEQQEEIERLKSEHREEIRSVKQRHSEELEQERSLRTRALSQASMQGTLEKERHEMELSRKDQEVSAMKFEVERLETTLQREQSTNSDLQQSIQNANNNASDLDVARRGLLAKIAYLESDGKAQSEAYAAMEKRMNEAIAQSWDAENKLRQEETTRRKLHNQIQELKGNIRVFCRVRPTLDVEDELANVKYPDEDQDRTEIEVRGVEEKNSLGKDVTKTHPFSFDRVFHQRNSNDDVFDEIELLIQSALDGFNVCIFAYGQTGSGKTYTMSSDDGMIPRSLRFIYETCKSLEGRGWEYTIEGSFVEVYNEEIRDLLGDESHKKYEVHHDHQKHETTITNATTLTLDNKEQVESILSQAMSRRSVAATKSNEHSSRSHSVFILKLYGRNDITGEESKGTLNLVDLAGSERIKNAETSGQRLKETQSINKSLSCLGDVIGALGQGPSTPDTRSSLSNGKDATAHVPYRNSKLTYLLQMSLGGNCKTLMFVMVAPEKKCLGETITSLKFAEKVSRTRVGVAKKVK